MEHPFYMYKAPITSYVGITRIRLKGRSSFTSSQPVYRLPCVFLVLYTYFSINASVFLN